MAKFSSRLTPEEQFEILRDFGFGTPTGASSHRNRAGRLDRPDRWQPMYTRPSMAMGYNFAVTPVQLAAAYGAIANDGMLLAPTLVREVRGPVGHGAVPPPARAGAPRDEPEVAAGCATFLRGRGGRGGHRDAARSSPTTADRQDGHRAPVRERATTSTASTTRRSRRSSRPTHPQLVVIVKIDNPRGSYYGGPTAAPVTRTMLQQALASRRVAIDRGRLAGGTPFRPPAEFPARAARASPPPWWSAGRPIAHRIRAEPLAGPDVRGRVVREAALRFIGAASA